MLYRYIISLYYRYNFTKPQFFVMNWAPCWVFSSARPSFWTWTIPKNPPGHNAQHAYLFRNATTANMHITYDTLVYGSTHNLILHTCIYIYVMYYTKYIIMLWCNIQTITTVWLLQWNCLRKAVSVPSAKQLTTFGCTFELRMDWNLSESQWFKTQVRMPKK